MSLRKVDAVANCYRFYVLDVQKDLFGQTLLARRWGRIGTHGRERFDEYPDEETAHAALAALALAKQRRGYQDRMISDVEPPKPQRVGYNGSGMSGTAVDAVAEPPLPF
jgi:predicted DNA-binding WGR domain protein